MDGISKEDMDEKYELVAEKVLEIERYIKNEQNLTMAIFFYNECANIYPEHPLLEEMKIEIDCRLNMMDCLQKAFDRALASRSVNSAWSILRYR